MTRALTTVIVLCAVVALTGCGSKTKSPESTRTTAVATPTTAPLPDATATPMPAGAVFGFTHHRADGNRLVDGLGALPDSTPLDIRLKGVPRWAVAAPGDSGSIWVVALDDGSVQGFLVSEGRATEVEVSPGRVVSGAPVHLKVQGDSPFLVTGPEDLVSNTTHPIETGRPDQAAFIDRLGNLVLRDKSETVRLELNALPDARILADGSGRLLLLTGATDRYNHGVLGDPLEAANITLVEIEPDLRTVAVISIADPEVVEGIAPIWADLDGDGTREIIATLSGPEQGARIVAFDETGRPIARGPAIGTSYRWRHQIAVAPFGPGGEMELAAVKTPHIGGIAEFYRLEGSELRIVARIEGVTSHVLGSRNLDMAAAGDFDGDGRTELLLQGRSLTSLLAVRRTDNGAEIAWSVPVGGRVSTNLAAATLPDGRTAVGIGREDETGGTLRVWLPPRR